jgi:hypothetical protein
MALFSAMWETTLQREVPEDKLSRVSSYDWMGSIAFLPAGYALAGPMMVVTRDVRELRGRPAPSRRPERMAA